LNIVTDRDSFREALNNILDYIAEDSLEKAIHLNQYF